MTALARMPRSQWPTSRGWAGIVAEIRSFYQRERGAHNHETRMELIQLERKAWRFACRAGDTSLIREVEQKYETMRQGPRSYWESGGYQDADTDPSLWAIAQAETIEAHYNREGRDVHWDPMVSIDINWQRYDEFKGYEIELCAMIGRGGAPTGFGGANWVTRSYTIPTEDFKAGGKRCVLWLRAGLKSLRMGIEHEWQFVA